MLSQCRNFAKVHMFLDFVYCLWYIFEMDFFHSKTIPKIYPVYKMNLDFWAHLGMEKTIIIIADVLVKFYLLYHTMLLFFSG